MLSSAYLWTEKRLKLIYRLNKIPLKHVRTLEVGQTHRQSISSLTQVEVARCSQVRAGVRTSLRQSIHGQAAFPSVPRERHQMGFPVIDLDMVLNAGRFQSSRQSVTALVMIAWPQDCQLWHKVLSNLPQFYIAVSQSNSNELGVFWPCTFPRAVIEDQGITVSGRYVKRRSAFPQPVDVRPRQLDVTKPREANRLGRQGGRRCLDTDYRWLLYKAWEIERVHKKSAFTHHQAKEERK